jgi:hypothetical protein
VSALVLAGTLMGCAGKNTPGQMEWISPVTAKEKPRVGTVYLFRGWQGVFSSGIDVMAKQLNDNGVTAYVYMPEQFPQVAAEIVKKYKGVAHPEPIVMIGHSRGSDSALIISREMQKAGLKVDLLVILDSVDEGVVTKNVNACYNYYLPAWLGNTNLLRGIPLEKEEGASTRLVNIDMTLPENQALRDVGLNHIDIDKGPLMQKRVVNHVLEVCPERAKWTAQAPQ